jgi:polysaccharide export outer membrane protein
MKLPPISRLLQFGLAAMALGLIAGALAQRNGEPRRLPSTDSLPTTTVDWSKVRRCQALGPAAMHPIWGVDSTTGMGQGEVTWDERGPVNWQAFAQGEYVGHSRSAHVPEYRLRVDDQVEFIFRLTREVTGTPYELQVGDTIRVESLTADRGSTNEAPTGSASDDIQRDLVIQPDGTISLPLVNQVRAAGMTVDGLRLHLEELYQKFYRIPSITVTPLQVNTRLNDLIAAVDARQGTGGLKLPTKVNPDGKIYMPGIGGICAQGLTVDELKSEIDARYDAAIPGVEVTPLISQRAPRFVFVMGEVKQPGRFTLEGPTTVLGAIAMAGHTNLGANLRQIVVLRRGDDWRLIATMLDLNGAVYARRPAPADEIWVNDSDIIIVPKTPILVANEFIAQFFTQGVYSMFPQFSFGQFNFSNFRNISQ